MMIRIVSDIYIKLTSLIIIFTNVFLILLLSGCSGDHNKSNVDPNKHVDSLSSGWSSSVVRQGGAPNILDAYVTRVYFKEPFTRSSLSPPITPYTLELFDEKSELILSNNCEVIIPNAKPRCSFVIKEGKTLGNHKLTLTSVPSIGQKVLNVYTIPSDTVFVASGVTKNNHIDDVFFAVIKLSEEEKKLAYIDRKNNIYFLGSAPSSAESVYASYASGNGQILIVYNGGTTMTLINVDGTTKEIKSPVDVLEAVDIEVYMCDGSILVSYIGKAIMIFINTEGEVIELSETKKPVGETVTGFYKGVNGEFIVVFNLTKYMTLISNNGDAFKITLPKNADSVKRIHSINNYRLIECEYTSTMLLVSKDGTAINVEPVDNATDIGFVKNSNKRILISYKGKNTVNRIEDDGKVSQIKGLSGSIQVSDFYVAGEQMLIAYKGIAETKLITPSGVVKDIHGPTPPPKQPVTFREAYVINEQILIIYNGLGKAILITPEGDFKGIEPIGNGEIQKVYTAGGNIVISYVGTGDVILIKSDGNSKVVKACDGGGQATAEIAGEQILISYKNVAMQNLITRDGTVNLIQNPSGATELMALPLGFNRSPNYLLIRYKNSEEMKLINPMSHVFVISQGLQNLGEPKNLTATANRQVLIDFTGKPLTFLISPGGLLRKIQAPSDATSVDSVYANEAANYILVLYNGTNTVVLVDVSGKVSQITAPPGVTAEAIILSQGALGSLTQISVGYKSDTKVTTQIFSDGSFITI